MIPQQGIHGPVAPGQYGPMQVGGPMAGFAPAQVGGPYAYYPTQTDSMSSMMQMIMPIMIMMIVMGMMTPMMKGFTKES